MHVARVKNCCASHYSRSVVSKTFNNKQAALVIPRPRSSPKGTWRISCPALGRPSTTFRPSLQIAERHGSRGRQVGGAGVRPSNGVGSGESALGKLNLRYHETSTELEGLGLKQTTGHCEWYNTGPENLEEKRKSIQFPRPNAHYIHLRSLTYYCLDRFGGNPAPRPSPCFKHVSTECKLQRGF